MRNTTYQVTVTQAGNARTIDSVEKLRKFNQHRSEYVAVPKSTFTVASDSQTLKFSKRRKRK